MRNNVKHIIFDLGNVILDIDYQLTIDAFKKLGIEDFQNHFSKQQQSDFMDLFETGKVSNYEFIEYAKKFCKEGTTAAEIIEAWNALLLDIPIRRLQILQQLQLDYDLFLLSNTNSIHEEAYNMTVRETCGYDNLNFFFNKVYLSHRIGLRKPNKEAFEIILNENKLNPAETLFIDDSYQHIEAAEKLGIQTIHMKDGMTMEDDIFKPKS
jgi:putative hydrolase of the HAD superfamily